MPPGNITNIWRCFWLFDVCVVVRVLLASSKQVEARNAVKQPTMHRMTGPNVARAEVENLWSGL